MQGILTFTISIAVLVTATDRVEGFTYTNKLLSSLDDLQNQTSQSRLCYDQLAEPFLGIAQFVSNFSGIFQELMTLNRRCRYNMELANAIFSLPAMDTFGSPALLPLTVGLTKLSHSVASIRLKTGQPTKAILSWEEPMKTLGTNAIGNTEKLKDVMLAASRGKQHIAQVATQITKMDCGKNRTGLLTNMESSAYGMDATPNMVISELNRSDDACQEVKGFFTEANSKLTRGLASTLNLASAEMDNINTGLDPIEAYLNRIDATLNKTVCQSDIRKIIDDELDNRAQTAEEIADVLSDQAEGFVDQVEDLLKMLGLRKLAAASSDSSREKREACFTIRQMLEDSLFLTGDNKTASDIFMKDLLKMVMPRVPHVSRKLKILESALMTFKSDFDLQTKVNQMALWSNVTDSFLLMDYGRTFWETPAQNDTSTSQTCEGEEMLMVPQQWDSAGSLYKTDYLK